ncbi:UDP-N-acetylmuramoyl-L-alanine--D-glutamate ligase [Lachnospiraceae bacterium ZAX-1]
MELNGKVVLVFGTGLSGIAAVELLVKNKIELILFDGNADLVETQIRAKSNLLDDVEIVLGTLDKSVLDKVDIAILSPGVPTDLPEVCMLRDAGIELWGEIELAYACSKGRILAITGTNGKTTTTALLGEIMKHCFCDVRVVGNIGIPYTSIAMDTTPETVIVAEISSFQLETVKQFTPEISAILNITPDHLNRHYTMENYQNIKKLITKNQTKRHTCVLNYEDKALREFADSTQANVVFFSSRQELLNGIYLKDEKIVLAKDGIGNQICDVKELKLIGIHNYENVMAAIAMAYSFGVSIEKMKEVLVRFSGVAHRIEYVATKQGVRYYNDSKGTNPDAAMQAIKAMQWPTLLIGGGYDKGSKFEPWILAFEGKVKKLILLGSTKEQIAEAAEKCRFHDYVFVKDLKEAVKVCQQNAQPGDAVLLSPACASWDMFHSYEERGDKFKEYVNSIAR